MNEASSMRLLLHRVVNRLGRPLGINAFPRAFEYALPAEDRAAEFDTIYRENLWGSTDSRSGVGSELAATRRYRKALAKLLTTRGFESMFDAPCGDLNWMPALLAEVPIRYQGGDISRSLIEQQHYHHPALTLQQFDICRDEFPLTDLWHCRDCLFHLPFVDIRRALQNYVNSQIPYALLTTHRAWLLHRNLDLQAVGFRFLDLQRAPFSLPQPLALLPDYRRGLDFPRYVGLWSRQSIRYALEHWCE